MPDKFSIIYSFNIHENKQDEFIHCWTELTNLIYKFEGSYGSRLHQVNENLFIAYAQWPDKKTFDQSGNKLPESANDLRKKMRECCSEIKKEYELKNIVVDLIKDKTF